MLGQCLGAVEVEVRENPSGLAAANSPAASRSRIYVSSCDREPEPAKSVAIGRGPYTSTHDPKQFSVENPVQSDFYRKAGRSIAWGMLDAKEHNAALPRSDKKAQQLRTRSGLDADKYVLFYAIARTHAVYRSST
jgi:hypothetical protein